MSMHDDKMLAQRIWEGDSGSVEDARKRYESDPEAQFVPWVSTLYSFREHQQYRLELAELLPQILTWSEPESLLKRSESKKQAANRADVLSTVLEWMPLGEKEIRSRALEVARQLVHHALVWNDMPGGHTRSLLALTYATILLDKGAAPGEVWYRLDQVRQWAPRIQDANQRARVYRKLAMLSFRLGS